jgi:hypothetical protein
MVVQIDARRFTPAAIPLEDEPPLLVDADRMEARQIAMHFFEVVAGRHPQVLIRGRVVDHLDFAEQAAFEIGWDSLRSNVAITGEIAMRAF